jgi:hypothetical protein
MRMIKNIQQSKISNDIQVHKDDKYQFVACPKYSNKLFRQILGQAQVDGSFSYMLWSGDMFLP